MDHRDIAAAKKNWYNRINEENQTVVITMWNDELEDITDDMAPEDIKRIKFDRVYDEVEIEVPFKWGVCSTCNGKGKHVNPAIDSHGISQEEWDRDWSDEDREAYFNGRYDVICSECGGKRVVPEPDENQCHKMILEYINNKIADEHNYARECLQERMMGC